MPKVSASADNKEVKIAITQPTSTKKQAIVKATYKGQTKTYTIDIKD